MAKGDDVPKSVETAGEDAVLAQLASTLIPEQRPAADNGPSGPVRVALRWQRRYAMILVVLDLTMGFVAGAVGLYARFGEGSDLVYRLMSAFLPFGLVAAIALGRGYQARYFGTGSDEYRRVSDAVVRFVAVGAVLAWAFHFQLARGYGIIVFPLALGLILGGRYTARQVLHRARRSGRCVHRVVVVGRERSSAELIRQLRRESHAGLEVVGVCADHTTATVIEGVPVVGRAIEAVSALQRLGADTLAVGAWSPLSPDELRRITWELEGTGVDVVVAPSVTDVTGPRIHIRPVAGLPLLHVEEPSFSGGRRVVKSLFDRVVALVALLVLAPLMLTIAAAVRLTSTGPALFCQTRVGRDGREFRIYKFRSMRVTAEEELAALVAQNEAADGLLFKIRKDPRITRVGGWLRRLSLDELPQLINVVKGEMSLVGPRPPLPAEVAKYASDVRRRLLVKPGLTGLWQVSGRSDLSWEQSIRLDLHYVENWSLALDVMILWKTAWAVLRSRGAY